MQSVVLFPGPAQLTAVWSTEKRFFVRTRGNEATLGLRFLSHHVPDPSIELGVPSFVPRPSHLQVLQKRMKKAWNFLLASLTFPGHARVRRLQYKISNSADENIAAACSKGTS